MEEFLAALLWLWLIANGYAFNQMTGGSCSGDCSDCPVTFVGDATPGTSNGT